MRAKRRIRTIDRTIRGAGLSGLTALRKRGRIVVYVRSTRKGDIVGSRFVMTQAVEIIPDAI